MHADELLADGLDEQRCNNRAVNAAGKGQQDLLVTDLLTDCGDLLIDERLGKFGSGDTHHVVGTLVGIHAELLFGSMEMRRRYADAPSYDLIICRTRSISYRSHGAFCRGGNIYLSRGQLGFDNHFRGGIGKLTVYTLGTLVSNTR